jgi:phosphatidylserine decarboxylase
MVYLLPAIGLSPGGSTHLHTNTAQNNTNNNQTTLSAVRAPSLRVLPWHLPYDWGKARKNLSQGKKNLNQVKENLSLSTIYILPKNIHTLQSPHKHTHYKTHFIEYTPGTHFC